MTSKEINVLLKGTFNTTLGKRCIKHLQDVFVDRAMYKPGMSLDQVAFREGEASVIRKIMKEINNV